MARHPFQVDNDRTSPSRPHDTRAMPTPATLFGVILFSVIGFGAFSYGRKQAAWRVAGIGVALMIYPYFVDQAWLLYAIGLALCAAIYMFWE